MGLFDGKKGLILGVANDRSLAWAIAEFVMNEGGICGFSHLPDRPDDEKKKNRLRVCSKCTDKYPEKAKILGPMDVQKDDDIRAIMAAAKAEYGQIDFLVHAIAYASLTTSRSTPFKPAATASTSRWKSDRLQPHRRV